MLRTRRKPDSGTIEELAPRTARVHEVTVPAHNRIGLELRGARVRRGESIAAVAQALRIRQVHLQALEDGRFGDLPGRAYVVGFLKSYGAYLGMDGDALADRFRDESGGLSAPAELNFPEPLSAPSLPTGRLVLAALALAVVAFGGWYVMQERARFSTLAGTAETAFQAATGQTATEAAATEASATAAAATEATTTQAAVDAVPAATAEAGAIAADPAATVMEAAAYDPPEPAAIEVEPAPAPAATASTAAAGATQSATALVSEDEVATPPSEALGGAADDAAVEATGTASTGAAAVSGDAIGDALAATGGQDDYVPQTFGRGNTDSRVKLRALGDAWVQIAGPGGELLLTRILQAGDVYLVPNQPGLTLVTGNAGGLEVSVDGVPVPALGQVGEVRRGVPLDPDRLKAGG